MAAKPKASPSENSKKEDVVKYAEGLAQFSIEGLKDCEVISRFNNSRRYYWGQHKRKQYSEKNGNRVDNKIAEIFQNRIGHIIDSRPKWNFLPQEEGDTFTALALNQIIGDVVWDFADWEDKGEDSAIDAAHAGSTHIKTILDESTGLPDFEVCPCGTVMPDPKATGKKTMRYIVHVIPKSVEDVWQQYKVSVDAEPDLNERLRSKGVSLTESEPSWYTNSSTSYNMDSRASVASSANSIDKSKWMSDAIKMALIYEVWIGDKTIENIPFEKTEIPPEHRDFRNAQRHPVVPEENHVEHILAHNTELEKIDSNTEPVYARLLAEHIADHLKYPQEERQMRYPYGRLITICQGKLLRDTPNPLAPLDWRDIFIKWDLDKMAGQYWGKQLLHDLYDLQDTLNDMHNSIQENMKLMTNGILKVRANVMSWLRKNKSKLNNLIGKAIQVNHPDDFIREPGQPPPQEMFQWYAMLEQAMEKRTGHEGPMAGRYPTGSPPGITVSQLLQEGKVSIRKIIRHYSSALRQMARNSIAIMVKFTPDSTKFRIMGEDNDPQLVNWKSLKDKVGMYDIRVDVASMLASSRQERFRQAVELAGIGAYDAEAVLEAVDDPKKYTVIQRVSKVQQMEGQLNQAITAYQDLESKYKTLLNRLQGSDGMGNTGE